MKREFLEELRIEGLTKDVIDQIMTENGKDIEAEKAKTTAKETELATANSTIKGLQGEIKKFDGVNVEDLRKKATEWETKYNTDIQTERDKVGKLKKEFTLKETLRESGVMDPDYLIYKHGGIDNFNYDKDGNLIGLQDTLKPYRESIPHIFKTGQTHYNPTGGGTYTGKNPFAKETFNLTEQGKLLKENPAQAKELASAAGISI